MQINEEFDAPIPFERHPRHFPRSTSLTDLHSGEPTVTVIEFASNWKDTDFIDATNPHRQFH